MEQCGNLVLFLCTALAAFGADDPWAKPKKLQTGTELRVYKKGAVQPLLVKMDDRSRRLPALREIARHQGE